MPATPVLIIWMKFMSTPLNAPQCRIKLRSNFAKLKVPFRKTNMWPNGLSYIGRSLWKNPPGSLKITTILNNFKHNLKKKSLWFNWKLGFIGLLLVFTYIPNPFIYLFIYLFILFNYLLFILLLTYFSFVFCFYFTYLPFSLPPLTIYFMLFIMHPFVISLCSKLAPTYVTISLYNIYIFTSYKLIYLLIAN